MKIHHLNCGTFCPYGGHLFDGVTKGLGQGRLVCHCLLIETKDQLVLVDTGLGTRDVRAPVPRLSKFFLNLLRPHFRFQDTAIEQIRRLGFSARDVRHIVLTHLDFDHAGGIEDFPHAEVHLLRAEEDAAERRSGFIARRRYRPTQFEGMENWNTYLADGERWFGFKSVRDMQGLPPEILMIPLIGHTWGHAGIAVQSDGRWLLHAGDAYFYREEMNINTPRCTPGLRAYQFMMEVNRKARLQNQRRLRELIQHHSDEVTVVSAHDPMEFLSLRQMSESIAPTELRRAA